MGRNACNGRSCDNLRWNHKFRSFYSSTLDTLPLSVLYRIAHSSQVPLKDGNPARRFPIGKRAQPRSKPVRASERGDRGCTASTRREDRRDACDAAAVPHADPWSANARSLVFAAPLNTNWHGIRRCACHVITLPQPWGWGFHLLERPTTLRSTMFAPSIRRRHPEGLPRHSDLRGCGRTASTTGQARLPNPIICCSWSALQKPTAHESQKN
jgi:hypothetical protein